MKNTHTSSPLINSFITFAAALIFAVALPSGLTTFAQDATSAAGKPSETVREFHKAMCEKRFRDAFQMSIFWPAVESLSAAEFEELRPDFERIARLAPEKLEITGEQISGDTATVFVKTVEDGNEQVKTHPLFRVGDKWIYGDKASAEAIKKQGKRYFFEARIETHHGEAIEMMQRIAKAQLAYSVQNGGKVAELKTLVDAGLLPPDIQTAESTGYRYSISVGKDGKTYVARAEPEAYGRTGRYSYFMDQAGMIQKDTGGKPIKGREEKKK